MVFSNVSQLKKSDELEFVNNFVSITQESFFYLSNIAQVSGCIRSTVHDRIELSYHILNTDNGKHYLGSSIPI